MEEGFWTRQSVDSLPPSGPLQDGFDNLLKTVQRRPPSPLFLLVLLVLPFAERKELLG